MTSPWENSESFGLFWAHRVSVRLSPGVGLVTLKMGGCGCASAVGFGHGGTLLRGRSGKPVLPAVPEGCAVVMGWRGGCREGRLPGEQLHIDAAAAGGVQQGPAPPRISVGSRMRWSTGWSRSRRASEAGGRTGVFLWTPWAGDQHVHTLAKQLERRKGGFFGHCGRLCGPQTTVSHL